MMDSTWRAEVLIQVSRNKFEPRYKETEEEQLLIGIRQLQTFYRSRISTNSGPDFSNLHKFIDFEARNTKITAILANKILLVLLIRILPFAAVFNKSSKLYSQNYLSGTICGKTGAVSSSPFFIGVDTHST